MLSYIGDFLIPLDFSQTPTAMKAKEGSFWPITLDTYRKNSQPTRYLYFRLNSTRCRMVFDKAI